MRPRLKTGLVLIVIVAALFVSYKYQQVVQISQTPLKTTSSAENPQAYSLAPYRHVTKSLSELGRMDEVGKHVLFLNRVPNSGSEMVAVLLKWLQGWNAFRHVRLKGSKRMLSDVGQEELVYSVYDAIRNEAVPVSFDRDVYFVNFTRFDKQSPSYVNLIRDPADYLLSRFHHIIHASSKKEARKFRTPESIEECVLHRDIYCVLHSGKAYDLAIPYFCGQDKRCSLLNDEWALAQAKSNVERYFSVVGILEEVNTTLEVFEHELPYFFKGVQNLYYRDLLEPFHRNKGKQPNASQKFRAAVRRTLEKEYEFYEWSKRRLFSQLQITHRGQH